MSDAERALRQAGKGSYLAVTTFRDAASIIDLARLVAARHKAKISTDVTGTLKALRIIDRGGKGKCCELAYTGDYH